MKQLHPNSHPVAMLINHAKEHVLSIYLPIVMKEADLQMVLKYGTYTSNTKKVDFVHHKITE